LIITKIYMVNKNIWAHKERKEMTSLINGLQKALDKKDEKKISGFLSEPENLRSLVINRGIGDEHHRLFLESFNFLLRKKTGKSIVDLNPTEIINFVHESDLPEQILLELSDIAFHWRDGRLFESSESDA
jgi:hypothetical protein